MISKGNALDPVEDWLEELNSEIGGLSPARIIKDCEVSEVEGVVLAAAVARGLPAAVEGTDEPERDSTPVNAHVSLTLGLGDRTLDANPGALISTLIEHRVVDRFYDYRHTLTRHNRRPLPAFEVWPDQHTVLVPVDVEEATS